LTGRLQDLADRLLLTPMSNINPVLNRPTVHQRSTFNVQRYRSTTFTAQFAHSHDFSGFHLDEFFGPMIRRLYIYNFAFCVAQHKRPSRSHASGPLKVKGGRSPFEPQTPLGYSLNNQPRVATLATFF